MAIILSLQSYYIMILIRLDQSTINNGDTINFRADRANFDITF